MILPIFGRKGASSAANIPIGVILPGESESRRARCGGDPHCYQRGGESLTDFVLWRLPGAEPPPCVPDLASAAILPPTRSANLGAADS